jgi:ribosome biogenesis GTPase
LPIGKIIKSISGNYYVEYEDVVYKTRGRGKFRYKDEKPLVGDLVEFQIEDNQEGFLLKILDRTNQLVRPAISNVDQAFIVTSCVRPDFSTNLLDKFLALINHHDIKPVIVVTKYDIAENKEEIDTYINDYKASGYDVVLIDYRDEEVLKPLLPYIDGKETVLAGQTGAGKSTLMNHLNPNLELKTNETSKALGRGKHTTRHVELFKINGGFIADTPGFSSIEFLEMTVEELALSYPDFVELSQACKFRGCHHINEPKCAVKDAVSNNEIKQYRYDNYVKFYNEIKERKVRY